MTFGQQGNALTHYKKYLRTLRQTTRLDIKTLPTMGTIFDTSDFQVVCKVSGITDKYYKALNGKRVYPYKKQRVKHNIYFNSGEVRDTIVTQVPTDCVPVLSDTILGLPADHKPSDLRLDYLDYIKIGGVTHYIYVIPKENLEPIKETAMVATETRRSNHYGGYQVTLKNGYKVYLLIMDYKTTLLENTRINVILKSEGLIDIGTVEGYIDFLSRVGMGHSFEEFGGEFLTEISPQKDFEPYTVTLDKLHMTEGELEDITAEGYLEGLE